MGPSYNVSLIGNGYSVSTYEYQTGNDLTYAFKTWEEMVDFLKDHPPSKREV